MSSLRSPLLCLACALLLGLWLLHEERARSLLRNPGGEACLACHAEVTAPGPGHPVKVMGCSPCHLGNPQALDKKRAHSGLVNNPGELRFAAQTCGAASCHPDIPGRVVNSVMATNRGMLKAMDRLWSGAGADSVTTLHISGQVPGTPGRDCFAKLCGSCHLWKPRQDGESEAARRGGGCGACHVTQEARDVSEDRSRLVHAALSTRIPLENCVRCHNRSARVGLTYQGKLEDDGYGTPFSSGLPGPRILSGGRHYLNIPPDVHFRAGMVCIDCHTGAEVMGDGIAHESLKGQLEITCNDCHVPVFRREPTAPEDAARLARCNGLVPEVTPEAVARARKGSPLYTLRPSPGQGGTVLHRKLDGKALFIAPSPRPAAHHSMPGHERLSCQACHSWFMPQCYGCHLTLHKGERQSDHILGRETLGRWTEARSFMRFTRPPLALVNAQDRKLAIAPLSPCQIQVSVFDHQDRYLAEESLARSLWTSFDPHSTQKGSRSCEDCHLRPESMGLGAGSWDRGRGRTVIPVYDSPASRFVSALPPGRVIFPRPDAALHGKERAFLPREIQGILSVAPCLPCHDTYHDPIYGDGFRKSLKILTKGLAPRCDMPIGAAAPSQFRPCDTLSLYNMSYCTIQYH